MLTNHSIIETGVDAGQIRKYRVIMYDGPDVWVQALNGHCKGKRLTFRADTLSEIGEDK